MADDDFLSTYGQSLSEANQSAADLQRLALQNMKSGSPGRMLLGAGQDVLAPAMGVMSPVTAGLDVARKALAYRFGEPAGNAFDVASTVLGGPEDIANALRLAGKVSPVAAMAALPRRAGSLESAVARAKTLSNGEIPNNLIPELPNNRNTQVFPELQERYPLTAPPVDAVDKNSGKPYLAKQLSDEALAVQKARLNVQKDIDEGNYNPYFKLSERADVDPSNYPEFVPTTNILKAKPETRAKYDELASTPDVGKRFKAAFQKGLEQKENSENWYFMKQLEDEFVKEYGPKEGRKQFKEKFADAMAATTGGADPTANLLMAHYGNYLKNQGIKEFPPTYALPYPIGGQYAKGNLDQYRKMLMEEAGVTPANPKRYNFSNNFLGNKGATIDEQMSDIFQQGMGMPPAGTYGHYENALNNFAQKAGAPDPRYFQEVAWAGEKDAKTKGGYKSKPMIGFVNEAIERTSRLTGMPPEEVVRRGLVRSEIPLYGAAGFAAINGLNSPSNETEPNFYRGGHVSGDDVITHALRIARKHFDEGGDVRGGDSVGGLSGDTGGYSGNQGFGNDGEGGDVRGGDSVGGLSGDTGGYSGNQGFGNDGPEQHETLNAFEARQDPQRYSDYEGNRLTAEERGPAPPQGGDFVPTGLGQSLFRDDSGEISVGQGTRSNVAGPTANQIAAEQANQEENRAMAANAAMAQRAGVMTGQPTAPTFTGNTTEEQQLADAEASRQAAINAAISGANYTKPTPIEAVSIPNPFADTTDKYTAAAATKAANLSDMTNILNRQGALTSASGTPAQSLAAVQPASQEDAINAVLTGANYTNPAATSPIYSNAAQQAAINAVLNSGQPVDPMQAALKRLDTEASKDVAVKQALALAGKGAGTETVATEPSTQPTATTPKVTGSGLAGGQTTPVAQGSETYVPSDPILARTYGLTPDVNQFTDPYRNIPVESVEDPRMIAAYNNNVAQVMAGNPNFTSDQLNRALQSPQNSVAAMALGARTPLTVDARGNPTLGSSFNKLIEDVTNPFVPMYLPDGSLNPAYNKINTDPRYNANPELTGQSMAPGYQAPERVGGGNTQSTPYVPNVTPIAAANIPPQPVIPGKPIPYVYPASTPYKNLGASLAKYANAIDWSKVPNYRLASGGSVGENNALANSIRMLRMQNRP